VTPRGDAITAEGSEGIVRNAGFALASQLITAAFTAALTVFLARVLGPGPFGVFSLALGLASVLALPGDAGIAGSASRFIAERRGDPEGVRSVLRKASLLRLVTSGAVTVILFVGADLAAGAYDEPNLAWTLRGMAVAIFGQNLLQLYGSSFTALGRLGLSFRATLAKSVVELAASVALVLAGTGAAGAAFGRGAGFLAGGALAGVLLQRLLRRTAPAAGTRREPVSGRALVGYAGALVIIDGAFVLFQQIDVLLIGAIVGVTAAGLFQAPLRLITFLEYPTYALALAVAPRLAGGAEAGREPLRRALRLVILFQGALLAPLVVWAEPAVELTLGPEYAESAPVLRALAPFVFLVGIGPLVTLSVNYLGEARRRVPIAIGALAVNAAIDVVLLPELGIIAGAIGTNVAYAIYIPAHLIICRQMIGLALLPVLVTVLRTLAAAAAMAGLLLALGTGDVSLPVIIGGGLAGVALYLLTLIALRETSVSEIRELGGTVAQRLLPSRT